MISDLMILEYAEKAAEADYDKARLVYDMFRDDRARNMMNDAEGTWRQIRDIHLKAIEKSVAGPQVELKPTTKQRKQAEAIAEELVKKQTVASDRIVPPDEPQKATAEPLDYTVNIEYTSGRKVNFHLDDKDMARHAYDSAKTMAKRLPGIISRIALVQHNTDKSETVLSSMDIG